MVTYNAIQFSIRPKPGKVEVHIAFSIEDEIVATMQVGEFPTLESAREFVWSTNTFWTVEEVTFDPMAPFIVEGR